MCKIFFFEIHLPDIMEILTKEDMHYRRYEHVDCHEYNQGIKLARAPVKGKQLQTETKAMEERLSIIRVA